MPAPSTASQLLAALAQHLDKRGIPYMIIGGQAVLVYGEPRVTRDIDVTVGLTPDRFREIPPMAEAVGLTPLVDNPEAFSRQNFVAPYGHNLTGLRVDVIFSFTPYEQEALRRVRSIPVGGVHVRFASPEDVVIHKIFAGRPRDLEDARGILAKNPTIDQGYVRRWLRELADASDRPLEDNFATLVRELGLQH